MTRPLSSIVAAAHARGATASSHSAVSNKVWLVGSAASIEVGLASTVTRMMGRALFAGRAASRVAADVCIREPLLQPLRAQLATPSQLLVRIDDQARERPRPAHDQSWQLDRFLVWERARSIH